MVVLKVITLMIYWLQSAFVCTLVARDDARVAGEYMMMARCWLASAFVCSLVMRDGKLVPQEGNLVVGVAKVLPSSRLLCALSWHFISTGVLSSHSSQLHPNFATELATDIVATF